MLAEIELFVKENYNPETISLFYRLFEAFDVLLEDIDYSKPYISIMMDSSADETSQIADRLRARLRQDIFELISSFEVKLIEETDDSTALTILEGLIDLPSYEDKDAIAFTIESGDSSIEIFADLMEFVTDLKENEVLYVIEFVPPELLTRLMENLDPQKDSTDEENIIDTALINKLKAYKEYTPNKDSFGFQLIRSGYAIGAEFKHYQQASGTMFDTTESIDTITDELLTIMYMSTDAYMNPLQYYTDNSSTIFIDDKRITQVYVKIKNRIAEFEAYYTNKQVTNKGIANAQTRPIQASTEV